MHSISKNPRMTKSEKFFWNCACDSEEFRIVYGQERCTVCLMLAKFFAKSREEQAQEFKEILAAWITLSAWLPVRLEPGPGTVTVPRDVAEKAAGWKGFVK